MNIRVLKNYLELMKKFEKYGIKPTVAGLVAYNQAVKDGYFR